MANTFSKYILAGLSKIFKCVQVDAFYHLLLISIPIQNIKNKIRFHRTFWLFYPYSDLLDVFNVAIKTIV